MTIIKDGHKAAVINERRGRDLTLTESHRFLCPGAAQGSSSCHKGYRDNE